RSEPGSGTVRCWLYVTSSMPQASLLGLEIVIEWIFVVSVNAKYSAPPSTSTGGKSVSAAPSLNFTVKSPGSVKTVCKPVNQNPNELVPEAKVNVAAPSAKPNHWLPPGVTLKP